MARARAILPLVGLLLVSATIAATTDTAWLGIAMCVLVTVCAARIGARVGGPRADGWHHARTLVVLGSLAYLVGLPVTWLLGRHVEAVGSHAAAISAVAIYLLFAITFVLEVRRTAPGSRTWARASS